MKPTRGNSSSQWARPASAGAPSGKPFGRPECQKHQLPTPSATRSLPIGLKDGHDIRAVQELFGHRHMSTTMSLHPHAEPGP